MNIEQEEEIISIAAEILLRLDGRNLGIALSALSHVIAVSLEDCQATDEQIQNTCDTISNGIPISVKEIRKNKNAAQA